MSLAYFRTHRLSPPPRRADLVHHPRRRRRHRRKRLQPLSRPRSSARHGGGGERKAKKKHILKKSKKSKPSDTEDESGKSSSDSDSDTPLEEYLGEDISGVPLRVHKRRANSHRKTFNGSLEWKGGALVEDVKTSTNVSTDFILDNHLSKRKRTEILNGDYVDMFTLLPPMKVSGKGEKKHTYGKRRYRTERNFENWLDGFQVFMGVISACYPKHSMHLAAYLAHVRRAYALAGEVAALTYDEDFRRNASLLPTTRWDLRDQNYWMEHVGPCVEKKPQDPFKSGKVELKRRRQCWEYNRGTCVCPGCKYLHECEKCLGNHLATSCFKGKQPFRGGRGHFHQGNRGAPGPSQRTARNSY
ncbi:Hypothetical predicted protein [Podarcis lilfordi]|uniref:C3H1-type domain-containing protein n=1 Tax=Podarcis lilfordi TaxID=74358 RepID=A0AA35LNU2_9SAUR|nr:Hypothetical predicted protein [Podarcis lilfordi]